ATFDDLIPLERQALKQLVLPATQEKIAVLADAETQLRHIKSAGKFRSLVKSKELATIVSLHLSSHGQGFGAFNQGWLYPLKPTINRIEAYRSLDEAMRHAATMVERSLGVQSLYRDTLRPSRKRSWQSYFLDRPYLGGEVSALAGILGVSLVTVDDGRAMWGTPYDTIQRIDPAYASGQSRFVVNIIQHLTQAPVLHNGNLPRNGFSTITGRAKFLRHGELFPDQPAPNSIILAYQGPGFFYTMVDTLGDFQLKGVADKKHVLHKVIIEGYRFDPNNGSTSWAIDKKQTGKPAYRIKMQRRFMETDLVMFACKQSTVFNLLEPRDFRHMAKIQLIDGRRESTPLRYWWSR
ncbi:MAG: peptide ABC transporter permease, partial [Desulfobulbaceae bacterium]|nr:peptide ABC transporter permease [Desulfobulbaceae bacterium]